MSWYHAKNGQQLGPLTQEEIYARVLSGEVAPTDLVWREGLAGWTAAEEVPELAGPPPSGMEGAGTPMLQPQPPPGMPVAVPGQYPVAPTSGLAIASMVCGIVGIVLSVSCLMGVITGIPAVICGHAALKSINTSAVPIQGRGMAMAGLVTGYLSIGLTVLLLVFFVFAMVTASAGGGP